MTGDGRDVCNRNDYYLGDPRLNRVFSRVKIAINAEEKFLLDVALVGLIIVLVWTRLRRNELDKHGNEPCCGRGRLSLGLWRNKPAQLPSRQRRKFYGWARSHHIFDDVPCRDWRMPCVYFLAVVRFLEAMATGNPAMPSNFVGACAFY